VYLRASSLGSNSNTTLGWPTKLEIEQLFFAFCNDCKKETKFVIPSSFYSASSTARMGELYHCFSASIVMRASLEDQFTRACANSSSVAPIATSIPS
jgi:hypothetical protein